MTSEQARGNIPAEPAPVAAVEVVEEVSEARGAADQPRPSQVRSRRPPLAPVIRAAVKAGARHRKLFGPLSPKQSAAAVRAYRAALVERRKSGRKPNELTVQVAEMLQQGMSWADIFKELGYHKLDKYERTFRKDNLRRVVNRYMKRNGFKSR